MTERAKMTGEDNTKQQVLSLKLLSIWLDPFVFSGFRCEETLFESLILQCNQCYDACMHLADYLTIE